MTDKQFIETLRNIRNYCNDHQECVCCKFRNFKCIETSGCLVRHIAKELWANFPLKWNIEEIERLANE